MSVLIFTVVIGLLQILNNQPAVTHADTIATPNVISHVEQQRTHPLSYSLSHKGIVGVVPATIFADCYDGRHDFVTLGLRDLPSEGPTCAPASPLNPSVSNGEPLLIFPLIQEGTVEERECVAIMATQAYCDIPSGSPLSAFPLV